MEISTDLLLGSVMIMFGLYTLIARQVAPQQFAKLEPMKEKFGQKGGLAVHVIGYTLLPIIGGSVILASQFIVK